MHPPPQDKQLSLVDPVVWSIRVETLPARALDQFLRSQNRTFQSNQHLRVKMEVAGVAIGGVGLAALFDTCMNIFEHIDNGRKHGVDYQKATLKVSVLGSRLLRWGQQVQFSETNAGGSTVATAEESMQVKGLLGQIQMDLENAAKATERYVLPGSGGTGQQAAGFANLEALGDRFRNLSLQKQKKTSFMKKARWAVRDKRKLDSLIEDITISVDSLYGLFPIIKSPSPQQRQALTEDVKQLVQPSEIEEPDDKATPIIEVLQEITEGVDDQLHEAVNLAAAQVRPGDSFKDVFTTQQARLKIGDSVASGYTGPILGANRYTREVNNMRTSDQARVMVGDSHGGKGIFDD